MTDDKIALCVVLKKGSDTFLRERIGFAIECILQLETVTLRGTGPASAASSGPTSATVCNCALQTWSGTVDLHIAKLLPG